MSIGEKLQACRKKLNLSQEALAEKLNVSRQTVGFWEKDQTFPTVENLLRLKELFGLSIDELLTPDERPNEDAEKGDAAEWTFSGFDKINRTRTVKVLVLIWLLWLALCLCLFLRQYFSAFQAGILTGCWIFCSVFVIFSTVKRGKILSQNKNILHKCVLKDNVLYISVWDGEREMSRRTLIPSDFSAVKASHDAYLLFFRGGSTAVGRETADDEPAVADFIRQINRKRDANT